MPKISSKHVIPTASGGWAVKNANSTRLLKSFGTQAEALQFARALAKDNRTELYVHAQDGSVVTKRSYGARNKIRIRLKASDDELIDRSALEVMDAATRTGASVMGAVAPAPRMQRFNMLRSRSSAGVIEDEFSRRTHQRLMDILEPNDRTFDALKGLNLPEGVAMDIKRR